MHQVKSPYESLDAVHGRTGVRSSTDSLSGLNRPEIINVMPRLQAEIPGYGLPKLEDGPLRFNSLEEKHEAYKRYNIRGLIGGVLISLALVTGDYIASLRDSEQQPEQTPVATEIGYHYDPATGEYYYYGD